MSQKCGVEWCSNESVTTRRLGLSLGIPGFGTITDVAVGLCEEHKHVLDPWGPSVGAYSIAKGADDGG